MFQRWNLQKLLLVMAVLCVPARAFAVDTYSRDTLRPLLQKDVNALIANHYFIQSMLAFDSTPLTAGVSVVEARANYQRSDGVEYKGSLSRVGWVLSAGVGRPTSEAALYGVLNMNGVLAGPFPYTLFGGEGDSHIRASTFSFLAAVGVAYKGWVAQAGVYVTGSNISHDSLGRLTDCRDTASCLPREKRAGAPESGISDEEKRLTNKIVTLENAYGYSISAMFGSVDKIGANGQRTTQTEIASLRALAQPNNLFPRAAGLFGLGLTTFAPDVDYYGDRAKAARDAFAQGRSVPTSSKGIVEFPLVGDRLGGTGAIARIVLQAQPSPSFRLAEVGYVIEGDEMAKFLPQAGARAKLFRRDTSVTGSADLYAGFFWVFSPSNQRHEGRGLSAYLTYSYNSPDASNFVPISDSHVMGIQIIFGNPAAMPPPVNAVKYPATARRNDDIQPGAQRP